MLNLTNCKPPFARWPGQNSVGRGAQELWAQVKVPIRIEKLEVKQVWYTSNDGTRVPTFLLGQKGMNLDGARPTLLTRYGGLNCIEGKTSPPGLKSSTDEVKEEACAPPRAVFST